MKAVVIHEYGPPDVLRYEEVPDPVPRAGEIRIKVHAATVNRVLDVSLRAGGDEPAVHADGAEGKRQHGWIGDVVVQDIHALAVGDFHDFIEDVRGRVIDAVIGAELLAERDARIGTGRRDHARADHVLGDLDADRSQIAAGAHDKYGLVEFEIGDVDQEIPCRRHVAQNDGGAMKIEMFGKRDRGAGRHGDHLGKSARPLDAHHAVRPVGTAAIFGAYIKRHETCGGDISADAPAADLRPDRIDDAGAIDAGNERQHCASRGFLAGAQAHVEDAIDGRRVHLDADFAGIVDAIGPQVSRWRVGDHVAAAGFMPLNICAEDGGGYDGPRGMMGIKRPGGFAELVAVPAMAGVAIPEHLDFHRAAVVMRHVPTAWNLLMHVAELKYGETVLIMGAGGNLGSIGIQIAKNVIGAHVIAAAGSEERASLGKKLGADHAINYTTHDIYDEVMKITGGKGVDVLYDNIANPKVLPTAFRAIGMDGRLVTAGAHAGPNVSIDFSHLYHKRITIKGRPGHTPSDLPHCLEAAAAGKVVPQIERVLPLSRAADAHRMVEAHEGQGKIVLDPTLG